jgi:outer membrane protein
MSSQLFPAAALLLLMMSSDARAQTASAPETLSDAWKIALAVDRRVRATRQLTDSALDMLAAAKAARRPTMNLDGGYTALSHAPSTIVDLPPLIVPGLEAPLRVPFDQLSVGQPRSWSYKASASLPLYTSGRIGEGVATANAQLNVARADEAVTALEIKLRVAEAYVHVLRATRLLEVTDSEETSLSAHAADAANLVEQGVTAKNDQLAAQVALADAQQQRLQAANVLDGARAAYNRLLDRSLDYAVTLEEPSLGTVDGDLATLTARAMARRPEIAAASHQADASAHHAANLATLTRPQASVGGGYSYQENQYQLYPGFWSVAVNVRWTVFDGGVTRAEAAATRSQADAAMSRRDDVRSIVTLEVRQAWLDVVSAEQRVHVARAAIELAEENLRIARDRYTAGVGIATEVLDAETLRTRSAMNAASAAYDHLLGLLRLRRAVGEL